MYKGESAQSLYAMRKIAPQDINDDVAQQVCNDEHKDKLQNGSLSFYVES